MCTSHLKKKCFVIVYFLENPTHPTIETPHPPYTMSAPIFTTASPDMLHLFFDMQWSRKPITLPLLRKVITAEQEMAANGGPPKKSVIKKNDRLTDEEKKERLALAA